MPDADKRPPLLDLVRRDRPERVAVEDYIFLSRDVSNSHLVTTSEGDVLVNAGTTAGGKNHKALYAEVRTGPLHYAVITQGHPDHFGGLASLKEPETRVIMQQRNAEVRAYWTRLREFYADRLARVWSTPGRQRDDTWEATPEQPPDIVFDDQYGFEVGERQFELFATPGGETTDSLVVWMPKERVVFTGNLFGPMFMNVPFLNTLRGDKIRSAVEYIANVDRVRALEPALLITGHGEPVRSAEHIARQLTQLRDAVQYLHDQTIEGMNAGRDVYSLMRDIQLPPELTLGEGHGKVAWAVRAIYVYYNGWFDFESIADMYHVPVQAVAGDLVELAGGAEAIAARGRQRVDDNEPLQALRLTDMALQVAPDNREALVVRKEALGQLLELSGRENLSETLLLMSAITAAEKKLEG